MHGVDFFVAQRAFVRAIFESQSSRSFVVGDASAFVGADKTYAGEIIGLLSFGRAKPFTSNLRVNRWINVAWLLVAWVVLQLMMGWLGDQQGYLLATPAHVGGFAAGLLLQRPLLLWKYRKA